MQILNLGCSESLSSLGQILSVITFYRRLPRELFWLRLEIGLCQSN